MRLLLDTHVALWFVLGNERLPVSARNTISEAGNEVFVSIVSLWEIAIKNGLRGPRAGVGVSTGEALHLFTITDMALHPLEPRDTAAYEAMSVKGGDPFDRMIYAQARSSGFTLMTHDDKIVCWAPEMSILV